MFVPNLTYPVSFPTPSFAAVETLAQIVRQSWPSLFPACESRLVSACRIASTPGAIVFEEFAPWLVRSESRADCYYEVEPGCCTCPDQHAHPSKVCKHRLAVHLYNEFQIHAPRKDATATPVEVGDLVTYDHRTIDGRFKVTSPVTRVEGKLIHVQYNASMRIILLREEIYEIDRPEAVINTQIAVQIPQYAEL